METKQARAIWYAQREKTLKEQQQIINKLSSIEEYKNSKYKTMGTYIRYHLKQIGYGIR